MIYWVPLQRCLALEGEKLGLMVAGSMNSIPELVQVARVVAVMYKLILNFLIHH